MTVAPGDKNGKHISLSDGAKTLEFYAVGQGKDPDPLTITCNPIDRNPLKTTSGNSTYSDFEYPYSIVAMDNFIAGRGGDQFEKDTTKYADGNGLNSERNNMLFLNGRETYSTGLRNSNSVLPGNMVFMKIHKRWNGLSFVANASYNSTSIGLWLRRKGNPAPLTVELCSATLAGDKDTVLKSATVTAADVPDTLSELYFVSFASEALVSGTTYFLSLIDAVTDTASNCWQLGVADLVRTYPTGWTSAYWHFNFYYVIADDTLGGPGKLFEYRGAQYFITMPSDGTASKLMINSKRGAADANTGQLTKLIDATKSWTTNQFVGNVVQIIEGPGSEEYQNWRTITANDATTLTVDTPWLIEHTTATTYNIVGLNTWSEMTGTGITKTVTDVVVSPNNVIYFAQGDATAIRRMRSYNNAGTWTNEYANDSTNKATFLALVHSATAWELWKGNNADAGGSVSVAVATPTAWGTDLAFATALPLGFNDERITSLIAYVDSNQAGTLWILTEGAPFYIQTGVPVRVPLTEYRTVKNTKNGRAAIVANLYLFFAMGIGIERYYDGTLDDIGPNTGTGLPANRQGRVVSMLAYPGRVIAAIDAGATGYSSVISYNGAGYCEIYRAPKGKRIYSIAFEPIPGTNPDRLWIAQGADMLYIPFPSETFDPTQDVNYPFRHEGAIELSWMNNGLVDAWKYYRKVKMFAEQLVAGKAWIEAEYKLDQDTTWTPLGYVFDDIPMDETQIGTRGVNAKRIKLRIRLYSTETTRTPILKAIILSAVTVTDTKNSYQFTSIIRKADGGETAVSILQTWAGTAKPLYMRSFIPAYDMKEVFLMAVPIVPEGADIYDTGVEFSYRVQMILQEA